MNEKTFYWMLEEFGLVKTENGAFRGTDIKGEVLTVSSIGPEHSDKWLYVCGTVNDSPYHDNVNHFFAEFFDTNFQWNNAEVFLTFYQRSGFELHLKRGKRVVEHKCFSYDDTQNLAFACSVARNTALFGPWWDYLQDHNPSLVGLLDYPGGE